MSRCCLLDGFKDKKADNLLSALEKSKHCELDAFLFAVGIPNIGRKTARDLANAFGTLEKVSNATQAELVALDDVGDIVAQSITEFFSFDENREMIRRLLAAGVTPAEKAEGGGRCLRRHEHRRHGDAADALPEGSGRTDCPQRRQTRVFGQQKNRLRRSGRGGRKQTDQGADAGYRSD